MLIYVIYAIVFQIRGKGTAFFSFLQVPKTRIFELFFI